MPGLFRHPPAPQRARPSVVPWLVASASAFDGLSAGQSTVAAALTTAIRFNGLVNAQSGASGDLTAMNSVMVTSRGSARGVVSHG